VLLLSDLRFRTVVSLKDDCSAGGKLFAVAKKVRASDKSVGLRWRRTSRGDCNDNLTTISPATLSP
jgi:hypothetical protein